MEVNLSEFKKNIISWYPINENQTVLQIGKNFEILEELKKKTSHVTVIEDLQNQNISSDFDFVTIIGFLEKVDTILDVLELIEFSKKVLKPEGKILLAMPNKFGMKYWSGIKQNEKLKPYETIEKNQENILSLPKIKQILDSQNLKYKMYYPLPDYRFANVIYTDEFLPDNESIDARILTYCEYDETLSFSEREAFKQIMNEEKSLFPFFANSFFIEIGKIENFEDIRYVSYSVSRKKDYRIKTIIKKDFAYKTSEEKEHIKNVSKNIKILENLKLNCLDSYEENSIKSKYLYDAISFDKIVMDVYYREGIDSAIEKVKEFKSIILDKLLENKTENKEYTIFEKYGVSIDSAQKDKMHFIKDGILDLIFQNCLVKDNEYYIYDQEWYEENVPVEFILFRTLFYLSELKNNGNIEEFYKKLELEDFIDVFEKLEEKIQDNILDKDMWQLHANSIKDIGSKDEIIDNYKDRLEKAQTHISDLEDVIKKYQDSIEELNNTIKNKDIELVNYADSLRAISNSLSWKITKPLRSVTEKLRVISKGK